jgi:3-phenylpropionate/trans-cinnamate dioxygenase ferredoxin component
MTDMMTTWTDVCGADEIEAEDVISVEIGRRLYAIYRSPEDGYYATDGLCTHEQVKLADGLVWDHVIECPKHNGQFDYTTGVGLAAPICVNLKTYPVSVVDGRVLVALNAEADSA